MEENFQQPIKQTQVKESIGNTIFGLRSFQAAEIGVPPLSTIEKTPITAKRLKIDGKFCRYTKRKTVLSQSNSELSI
jgi:hypothetical protein